MKCNNDCLNCKLPQCKYDLQKEVIKKKPKSKVGRPRKYPEGTYWKHYYEENGEYLRARERERYIANREKKIEYGKKYREEHREELKQKRDERKRKSESINVKSKELELGCQPTIQARERRC